MKTGSLLLLTLALSVFSLTAAAQTEPQNTPKAISGGILNGKATYLAKPVYPRAALDARVGGATVIEVLVDEGGNVVSAKGVSGNPLLVKESEQAALQSKFAPVTLSGERVRVRGVIVYNFVLPMPYFQIGYELALAQKTATPEAFPLDSISGTLPGTWFDEKAELKKLRDYPAEKPAAEKKVEPKKEEPKREPTKQTSDKNEARFPGGGNVLRATPLNSTPLSSASLASDFMVDNKSATAVGILANVQTKIENRLEPNSQKQWYFRVGRVLGSLAAEVDDAAARRSNLAELEQLLGKTPFGVRTEFAEKFRAIADFSKLEKLDAESKGKLLALLKELRESRIE